MTNTDYRSLPSVDRLLADPQAPITRTLVEACPRLPALA